MLASGDNVLALSSKVENLRTDNFFYPVKITPIPCVETSGSYFKET